MGECGMMYVIVGGVELQCITNLYWLGTKIGMKST